MLGQALHVVPSYPKPAVGLSKLESNHVDQLTPKGARDSGSEMTDDRRNAAQRSHHLNFCRDRAHDLLTPGPAGWPGAVKQAARPLKAINILGDR